MIKSLKPKFLYFFLVLFFIFVSSAEAKTSKVQNIADIFLSVNPSLSAAKAKDYAAIVVHAGEKFKQDPYVIAALIVHESTVNHKALSKGGDYGLMQVRWKVHEKAIKKEFPKVKKASDMFDARTNILYGTEVFSYCMSKANNNLRGGILRYSGGNEKLVNKVFNTVNELKSKENNSSKPSKKVKAKKK